MRTIDAALWRRRILGRITARVERRQRPLIDARSNGGFIRESIGGNQRGEKGLIQFRSLSRAGSFSPLVLARSAIIYLRSLSR